MRFSVILAAAAALSTSAALATGADAPATQPAAPDLSSHILTPPAPKTPRINGTRIYGERPGRPFLFTIPATGERPMKFEAAGLPEGLTLDASTGRITGSVDKPGEFTVQLKASNSLGSAHRELKIVIGDQIALTPPMGWNSWNCWAGAVDQEKVLKSARAMAASGLIEHGWTYINIDDTWQGKRDPQTHALQSNEKFPDMKKLCGEIHNMGLKAGIYSTPWTTSYAIYPGGSSDNPEGTWHKPAGSKKELTARERGWYFGKYAFAAEDAKQWAAWGFDYLKYDWHPNEEPEVKAMHDALLASGRDIVYSLSNSLLFQNAEMASRLANSWRTTGDIRDTWQSIASIGFAQSRWAPYAGPGHFNDPDMLVVGYVGWGPRLHPSRLTPDEQYTHISLWSLLSAPLLIGCDLDRLDPFTLNLLTNDEVLAIDQDPLAKEATLVSAQGPEVEIGHPGREGNAPSFPQAQVWAKELEDGSRAVGLFNLGTSDTAVKASFADLKLEGRQTARDLWRQKNLGTFSDSFEATVPPHGVVLVKLSPAK